MCSMGLLRNLPSYDYGGGSSAVDVRSVSLPLLKETSFRFSAEKGVPASPSPALMTSAGPSALPSKKSLIAFKWLF